MGKNGIREARRVAVIKKETEPLVAGDRLTREEFIQRWEAMPHLKRAELIGGIVYMPASPVSLDHGDREISMGGWLWYYAARTPGCRPGSNATWYMLEDAPQPDVHLRILPEYGGKSKVVKGFAHGAPELISEVCLSSASYDLNQKKELYRAAGVNEYFAVVVKTHTVHWFRLVADVYKETPPDAKGVIRSLVFPGLWLDTRALLKGEMAEVLKTLDRGLKSKEHREFVALLASRRKRSS